MTPVEANSIAYLCTVVFGMCAFALALFYYCGAVFSWNDKDKMKSLWHAFVAIFFLVISESAHIRSMIYADRMHRYEERIDLDMESQDEGITSGR